MTAHAGHSTPPTVDAPHEPRLEAAGNDLSFALGPGQVSTSAATLLAYARDAYPIAVREALHGADRFQPAIVVWPRSTTEIVEVLAIARRHGLPVVPYGAGSGIVGGALGADRSIVLDLKRLDTIGAIDPVSLTVVVGSGVLGHELETHLGARGYTSGHYPQSLYSSTVGGWVAHRGVGTFSTRYGKIDDMVLGMQVVLPDGSVVDLKPEPQSAAGPDLKRLFLGSEGTLGVITLVTLQVHPLPAERRFLGFACDSFGAGLDVVRRMVQAGYRPAAVRLYDPVEASVQLGTDPSGTDALLIAIAEGPAGLVDATARAFDELARESGLRDIGPDHATSWLESRFSTAGLVSTNESETGIADALEVANDWARLEATYRRMKSAMEAEVGPGGRVFGHASHFYHSGANLYMIFHAFAQQPNGVEARYRAVLDAAFDACLATGGTITHHHGVGIGKRRYMSRELGTGGSRLLGLVKDALDPDGLMNPGKLVGDADG